MEGNIPCHIAMIMDGNGRWAKKRLMPRSAGHRAGFKRMVALSEHAFDLGVRYMTMYALSTENFSRPQAELDELYSLFRTYFTQNVKKLREKNIRLKVIGNRSLLPSDIVKLIEDGENATQSGERGVVTLAIGYGARQEIVAAVNQAIKNGEEVTQESFSALLSTEDLPEPDLLIRTGKEKRLSNFLLWQCAYTEFYFSDKMFPAFTNRDLEKAIEDYAGRDRRFGKLSQTDGE